MRMFFDDNIFSRSPFGEKLEGKFENQPHCTHCTRIFYRNVPSTTVFLFKKKESWSSCFLSPLHFSQGISPTPSVHISQ